MSELFWVNGAPFAAIDPDLPLVKPNFETFWMDGYSGIELLPLADTYPYTPPPPQPPPSPSPWGSETYWIDGYTSEGFVKDPEVVNTNFETYWNDGFSAIYIYPIIDSYPYIPPPPQPPPSPSPWGSETYWIDGYTSEGFVKDPEVVNTNFETYWNDGFSAIYIYPIIDSYPYTPPPPQPLAYSSFYGNETFWSDGTPDDGLKTSLFNHTGHQTFWVDGSPVDNIFESDNFITGRTLTLFDK